MKRIFWIFGTAVLMLCEPCGTAFAQDPNTPTPTDTPTVTPTFTPIWTTPVNISNDNNESRYPCIAVDDNEKDGFGRAHIVWTEESGSTWGTYYVVAIDGSTISMETEVSDDAGTSMVSTSAMMPFLVVDLLSDKASIAFQHVNSSFYESSTHSQILFLPFADVVWPMDEDPETQYLEYPSGLQIHVRDPFVFNSPCTERLKIFWSNSNNGSDTDNDIFFNYQVKLGTMATPYPTPTPTNTPKSEWIMISKGADSSIGESEISPYVTGYIDPSSGYHVDVVAYDDQYKDSLIHSVYTEAETTESCAEGSWNATPIPYTSDSYYPSTALDSDKNLYIAYHKWISGSTSEYYILKYDGSYSSDYPLGRIGSGPSDYQVRPVLGCAEFGGTEYLYIVFVDASDDVKVGRLELDDDWKAFYTVDNTSYEHHWVHLAIDPVSNLPHVVYEEEIPLSGSDVFWCRLEPQ